MPYCPKCGGEVAEGDRFCPHCGERLERGGEEGVAPPSPGALEHLSFAFNLASRKPMVFAPAILGGVISMVISGLVSFTVGLYPWGFTPGLGYPPTPRLASIIIFAGLASIVGAIISYILFFASLDMSRDAYLDRPLDLGKSVGYVLRRLGTIVVASIVGAILMVTIILIPVALIMFVILVFDETGIGDSISKAFGVLRRELGDIIILLIIAIAGSFILGLIPMIGSLLSSAFNVIISIAFIDLYSYYKKAI
ncbi:MAG: zinc ribbon domain-containing protein [Candidatus Bathyarchaeia archaeon]|nr:zinc-ribbon domain-containing protein [Candidatus Bathyarchaeota archaeon]